MNKFTDKLISILGFLIFALITGFVIVFILLVATLGLLGLFLL